MTTEYDSLHDNNNETPGNNHEPHAGHSSAGHSSIEEQLAAVRDELEESRREASQNLNAAQRAQAELVNYKRRTDEERIELGKYSNSRLITKVLPVMEELDLAVVHAGNSTPNSSWLEGVKLIQRKLANLLQSEGVSEIEAVGIPFNPIEHEAVGTEETAEYPPGYVTEAVRPGYRLHDRIIQPAQVMVAREVRPGSGLKNSLGESSKSKET
jgi:molecular chaperone GrpE